MTTRVVVLVEGESDRIALRTLAKLRDQDLAGSGVEVVAMHGITNTRRFAREYGPRGRGLAMAGLYDAPEESKLRHGLAAAGMPEALSPGGPARLGFHCCTADLEDELIRALGEEEVVEVIATAGERRSLERLTQMPAQRDWTRSAVIRRFLGSQSGRKARYAELLVEALGPDRAPTPLRAVLDRIR